MKHVNWWVWERSATIHLTHTAASSADFPLKQFHKECYGKNIYGFFKNGMVRWICDLDGLILNGKKILPDFIDPLSYKKKLSKWKELTLNLEKTYSEIDKIDLSKLSDKELLDLYIKFDKDYINWWGYTQVAELISYGGEDILKKELEKKNAMEYFTTLVTPTQKSYTNKEEEDLFEIVKLAKEKGINDLKVVDMIKKYTLNYFWIHNNFYDTINLDEAFFKKMIKQHLDEGTDVVAFKENNEKRLKKIRIEKKDIIKSLDLSEDVSSIIWLIDDFCRLQDERKAVNMKGNFYVDNFCKEFSRRKKISYTILRWAVPDQIKDLLDGVEVDVDLIKKQGEHCVIIFNDHNLEYEIYVGKDASEKEEELLGKPIAFDEITEIEGMCANTGRVKGKVRKLLTPRDINKMEDGEILVSTMTSPDFVPAMKKASAIVTDEGGITCHAAVISRELGIPCVIGTKIATKVLKDGDLIEIKANHGLIFLLDEE